MANLSTRIRKLEAQLTVKTGPAPCSNEWFTFWGERFDRLIAGEAPERTGRIPLEVIDQMRERPCSGGTAAAGVMRD